MNRVERAAAALAYLDILYNLASWLVHEPADAHALVHETYRRALHTLPQQLSGTKLRVRLLTIMWEIYRQHHYPNSDPPQPSPFKGEGWAGGTAPPGKAAMYERSLLHTLPKGELDAGLRRLPEDLRAVLILADMEGCPLAEVAEIFGCPGEQAQAALSHARRSLRSLLEARIASSLPPPESEDQS
ncbi:MAG: hypothetical protein HYZ81_16195 [Nitrospinae bacterium]|nr:hypothetical protein [Nitrospinota bacterium]